MRSSCDLSMGHMSHSLTIFLSLHISKGSGIPKVVDLQVQGELVEGSIIRGCAEVAWCGGTPGKGVAR